MKKSIEIFVHLSFWVLFILFAVLLSKIYLEVKPDAPFAQHFAYVIFMEVAMGVIFFYTTFFVLPWAGKKTTNAAILGGILLALLILFAIPAMGLGIWQVLSSVVPHLMLVLLAFVFRKYADSLRAEQH